MMLARLGEQLGAATNAITVKKRKPAPGNNRDLVAQPFQLTGQGVDVKVLATCVRRSSHRNLDSAIAVIGDKGDLGAVSLSEFRISLAHSRIYHRRRGLDLVVSGDESARGRLIVGVGSWFSQ